MSPDEIKQRAKELSERKYTTVVEYDPEGNDSPDYLAYHPELPGCKAQGRTAREAKANLDEVRLLWIENLIEDDLPVPDPEPLARALQTKRVVQVKIVSAPVQEVKLIYPDKQNLRLQPA